jgi:NADH dehydrogenase
VRAVPLLPRSGSPAFRNSLLSGDRNPKSASRPRVVIVGGGFGGVQATLRLARLPVDVDLVDRRNFHLFQPLTYQVATGALSPSEIAYPLRQIVRRHRNVRVILGEVTDFDLDEQQVILGGDTEVDTPAPLPFDLLIVAAGSRYSYFGHKDWQRWAPNPKTIEDAVRIRRRLLTAFERAELEPDAERRHEWLTFVVVGAGPTGVEMAGQIAELAHDLRRDFRHADLRQVKILLVEAGDRALPAFDQALSRRAGRSLERLGVAPLFESTVVGIDDASVLLKSPDSTVSRVPARTVIWAAGVAAADLSGVLASRAGVGVDRAGRIEVLPDLSLPGHPDVLAIGDMVRVCRPDGGTLVLPGLAPVAMQQGRHAAQVVRDRLSDKPSRPFRYRDKGGLATIGRARAVAEFKGLRLSGLPAWIVWVSVHLWYLIGFQNRVVVLVRWAFSFIAHRRSASLITLVPPSHETPMTALDTTDE